MSLPIQLLHGDIDHNKAAILDAIHNTDQFLREKRGKLSPEKVEELQQRNRELRDQYDQLCRESDEVCKQTEGTLTQMKLDLEETVRRIKYFL